MAFLKLPLIWPPGAIVRIVLLHKACSGGRMFLKSGLSGSFFNLSAERLFDALNHS
jgi:hypothetical protein